MPDVMTAPPPADPVTPTNGSAPWTVVAQVKSLRVVYVTQDPDYRPPMEGDWYYVSGYVGDLPPDLTLQNCWRWRFDGSAFIDARDPPGPSRAEALLENNRRSLLGLLNDKINAVRAPYRPSVNMGDAARAAKLAEAQRFLALDEAADMTPSADGRPTFPLLEAAAVARNITMTEAAGLIIGKAAECDTVLRESERFREQMARAIESARDDLAMLSLREWLLNDIYPALTERFKAPLDNTRPIDRNAPLNASALIHERARLKVQLREKINLQRASLNSDYVQNDAMLKHKARLAQLVLLRADGEAPPNEDVSVLRTYAEARGLTLRKAAEIIQDSLALAGSLLMETEQERDRLLAAIDGAGTLGEIKAVAQSIDEIGAAA